MTKSGVSKPSVWCCVMPATARWYRWYCAGELSPPCHHHHHTHTAEPEPEAWSRSSSWCSCVMSRPHSSQPAASGAQSGHTQVSLRWSVLLSPSEAVHSQGDSSHRFPQLGRINTFYFCQQWLQSRPDVTWRRKAVAAKIFLWFSPWWLMWSLAKQSFSLCLG